MLKELEDYNWFPAILRRWQMEFIGTVAVWAGIYKPLTNVIAQIVTENNVTALQDVCSGSGASSISVYNQLAQKIPLLLSDKYPVTGFKSTAAVSYNFQSVDVMQLQPEPQTCYTMFNAFHHFNRQQQQDIMQNMVTAKVPFLFVEILEPGILNVIKIFFTTILVQLFGAPFIKPFSVTRLFFTYIIPVNLFTITYDGVISVLKSKSKQEYTALVIDSNVKEYQITVHKIKTAAANIIYIKGQTVNR